MAAFLGSISLAAEVALSAGVAKTVLQLVAPTNHRVKILRFGVFFDGTSTTGEPVQIRLLLQTTAGTMSALTPVKLDGGISDTIQSTAQHTATVEPTAGSVIETYECHPQQGIYIIFPQGQEPILAGTTRIGLELTAPASVNCRATIVFEE